MVYEEFKRMNDESKKYFSSKMKIVDVDFEKNICTVAFEGRITSNVTILTIIENVCYDGMGVLSNPSKLKSWKGFEKN